MMFGVGTFGKAEWTVSTCPKRVLSVSRAQPDDRPGMGGDPEWKDGKVEG